MASQWTMSRQNVILTGQKLYSLVMLTVHACLEQTFKSSPVNLRFHIRSHSLIKLHKD